MNKYTRLCITICINVEIVSSACYTATNELTIILEIKCK